MTYANINRVYTALQVLLNKQQLGFVSPSQFNTLARVAQDIIFDSKIDDLNGQVRNKIRQLETVTGDLQNRAEEDISSLFEYNETQTASSGTNIFAYPSNVSYIKSITYKGNIVDRITPSKATYYVNNNWTPPTDSYSIAIMGSNQIEIIGEDLTEGIKMSYYRRPRGSVSGVASANYPTWAYTTVGENQVYSSANSYDFELPSHMEHELVMEIASLMGVNLRDAEVVQYAEGKIAKDKQQETPS